jgi:TolB-like protein/predicted Ser/Thr protein kinase
MTKFSAVHDGKRTGDSRVMTSAPRICRKCGAEIFADAPEGLCTACLFETGLDLLAHESVAGVDDPSRDDRVPLTDKTNSSKRSKAFADFGDYELLEVIGRGGQGVVYRARQKSLNRIVALKVIGLGHWATGAHLKRFRREAEAAASLDHSGIVPIYEVGERDGSCYFSMKLVEGGQLGEVLKSASRTDSSRGEREPMPIRQAVTLIAKVARTVHYAHEHGILHRDIKPGNILLDQQNEPHLTDFGLARLIETESTVTRTQEVLGTPSYMPPEQAVGNNEAVTSVTDVYGLGAVLYHLLTGQPPFAGGTTYETIKLLLDTEPRQPRQLNPKIDRDLSTICLKCLEKDPKRRYFSALAVGEDLERWLKHEPIQARRTGVIARGGKWIRRNMTTAGLFAALVALATIVAVLFFNGEPARPPAGIAVLPFENLGGNKDDAVLVDGLQDDILTRLAKVASLKVISHTSVMQYRGARNIQQIRDSLHVSHVLEGSVRRDGDKIHLNAQLIDTQTDEHIWAEQYERNVNDVFAVQDEIAQRIANQLQAKLSSKEKALLAERPTSDPVAYAFYEQAKNPDDPYTPNRTRIPFLQKAIQRDPNFLLAYCLLGKIYANRYGDEMQYSDDERVENARLAWEVTETALRMRPDRGEPHLARAYYYFMLCQYPEARSELDLARKLLPNDSEAVFLDGRLTRYEGSWDDALAKARRAFELDPHNEYFVRWTAEVYSRLRRYRAGEQFVRDAINRNPALTKNFNALLAVFKLLAGDLDGALEISKRCTQEMEEATRFYIAFYRRDYTSALQLAAARLPDSLGYIDTDLDYPPVAEELIYRARGEKEKAETIARSLRAELEQNSARAPHNDWYYVHAGELDAALGLKEQAVAEGRKAVEMRPIAWDPVNGPVFVFNLAKAYALSGERDLAIEQLEKATRIPSEVSYGGLRYNPRWDILRGDPRFEKIVAALAPKEMVSK